MSKQKHHNIQDALEILSGDDGESEGCDGSSHEDEDLYDLNHTPNNKDKTRAESRACGDSDSSESSNLAPECTFKGPCVTSPNILLTPLEYFQKFITPEMAE